MLEELIFSLVKINLENKINAAGNAILQEYIHFQQDCASPHPVIQWLRNGFPRRTLFLTPLDFFLSSILLHLVLKQPPKL